MQPLLKTSIMFKIYWGKTKKIVASYSMLYTIYFQDPIELCFLTRVPRNSGVREMRMLIFVHEKKGISQASRSVHDFSSTATIHVRFTINAADPSGRTILRSRSAPGRLLRSRIPPEAYVCMF